MIALITSTICPSNESHSYYNETERYVQTIETIKKLKKTGFSQIYIFDNSVKGISENQINTDSGFTVNFTHSYQYPFVNKGVNEALLILNNLYQLPDDQRIFKISGRYYPNTHFSLQAMQESSYDFIGRGYNFDKRGGIFSTRAYAVKNKALLEQLMVLAIEDMLGYGNGIYGVGSFIKQLTSLFSIKPGTAFQISIEHAVARVLKSHFTYNLLDQIGIEGLLAGSKHKEFISE
jgi:hypothetical protein